MFSEKERAQEIMRKGGRKRGNRGKKEGVGGKREAKGREKRRRRQGGSGRENSPSFSTCLSFLSLTSPEKKDYLFEMRGGEREEKLPAPLCSGSVASESKPNDCPGQLTLASRVKPE